MSDSGIDVVLERIENLREMLERVEKRMDTRDVDCKVHYERTIKIENQILNHDKSINGIVGGIVAIVVMFVGGVVTLFFKSSQ